MLRALYLSSAAIALAAAATPASAVLINFDTSPSGAVADGTLITNQYASLGVTFSAILGGNSALAPVATMYAAGPAGPNYAGNFLGNAANAAPGNPRYDIVRLVFNGTASGLSLSLNNFSMVGTTTFNAYNSAGTLIETFTTSANSGWAIRTLSSSGIARLDLLNNIYNESPQFFGIDQLNFTLTPTATPGVPEPSSWALMIAGFGLLGGAMRRRSATTVRVRYA